jgi:threonine/homoserine/homoserine lactone efflux protein
MQLDLLIRGLIIGLSIAVPVGPIAVLCIRRTIAEGRLRGFITGLGAATGDATYGGVAAFGLSIVTNLLIGQQIWLRLIGGAFLIYLGARTFKSRPQDMALKPKSGGIMINYLSTLLLTVTNPLTILMFTAVFAGFGVSLIGFDQAAILTLGVFLGSVSWWVTLTLIVGFFRDRFDARWIRVLNIGSGLLIASFGFWSLTSLVF